MRVQTGFVTAASIFLAGALTALAIPYVVRVTAQKWFFPSEHREIARVTSPDGAVDAVTDEIECGAPCSSIYEVSIVPRAAPQRENAQIFTGEGMLNAKVSWVQPHLLNISYDKAFVDSYRSVTYPLGPQPSNGHVYAVEIRLSPSSPDFSYLTSVENHGDVKRSSQ